MKPLPKKYEKLLVPYYSNHLLIEGFVVCLFPLEILDGVELGEPAHKKTGTTVPESIHSFIGDGLVKPEALNKKAIQIINRVRDKLTGRDFSHDDTLDVPTQVELLIKQATSHENLCQCYIGWCPFW